MVPLTEFEEDTEAFTRLNHFMCVRYNRGVPDPMISAKIIARPRLFQSSKKADGEFLERKEIIKSLYRSNEGSIDENESFLESDPDLVE